jgi:hypothetical protein
VVAAKLGFRRNEPAGELRFAGLCVVR